MEEPGRGILNKNLPDLVKNENPNELAFPSIKIEEPEQRGRSRNKTRELNSISGTSANRSKSRSASRASLGEKMVLKWTILNRDPSERLHLLHKGSNLDELNDKEPEDFDEEDEDEDDEVSDEEQISDVENEVEIDKHLDYDLGMKALPNFVISINQVLDSMKPWISKMKSDDPQNRDIELTELQDGVHRAVCYLSKASKTEPALNEKSNTYILYLDQMDDSFAEKIYALVYAFGGVLSNGDTLYIINQCDDDTNDMKTQITRICDHVDFLFDATNGAGTLDNVDVVICSIYHPYPKQLLTELSHSLQPTALIVPLQTVLSILQNFVTSVPMLVIRKKLKRARRKGIYD